MSYRQVLVRITIGLLITTLLVAGCSRKNNEQQAVDSAPAAEEVVVANIEPTEEPTEAPTDAPAEEPTSVPVEEPIIEPAEDTTAAAQPESPLAGEQPTSPLAAPQPGSPLAAPTEETALNVSEPVEFDTDVEEGQALVVGVLISNVTGEPLKNTVVRFPEVNCPEDGENAEGNDAGDGCFWTLSDAFTPGAVTLDDGSFEVKVEEPSEYMFLVGDMMTVFAFAMVDKDNAYRFDAPADTAIDLGQIIVDYQ